jgi:Holliday junction resolvase RusA-like endonuclease
MVVRTFWTGGTPKGQPRARARRGLRGVYDPGTAKDWKTRIGFSGCTLRPDEPIDEPVEISLCFVFPRPRRLQAKRHPDGRIPYTAKPDLDNLEKAVLDALVVDGWFRDDSLVFLLQSGKFYAARQGQAGVLISVKWGTEEDGDVLDQEKTFATVPRIDATGST